MITIEDKIQLFERIVLDDIKKELDQFKQAFEKQKEKALEEHKKQAQQKAQAFTQRFVDEAEEKKEKEIAQSQRIKRERIMDLINELINKVYQSVLNRCKAFIHEEQYMEVFQKLIQDVENEVKDFEKMKIYIIQEDFENNKDEINQILDNAFDEVPYELLVSEENFYGGFMIYNAEGTVKIDSSLKSIINKNKGFIGHEVHNLLDELGDMNV